MLTTKQAFKFAPTVKGIVIFYGIIFFNLSLTLARRHPLGNIALTEVFSHTSNFAITSMMLALMSFIMGLQGAPFKFTVWLGVAAIVLNFIVELFIPLLNTPDVIDAIYGAAGVVLTTFVMYAFYKIGIRNTV